MKNRYRSVNCKILLSVLRKKRFLLNLVQLLIMYQTIDETN